MKIKYENKIPFSLIGRVIDFESKGYSSIPVRVVGV